MQESIRLVSLFLISSIFQCNGVSLRRQLEHIAKTRLESQGLYNDIVPSRRYMYDPRELKDILGVPSRPSHLPEAEAILPGHTLNRPALGMLKSAIKFPHKELEDGTGVYGSFDNLGLKYDSKSERLLYTEFRRSPSDYIMVIPSTSGDNYKKPRFKLESTVLDLDDKDELKILLEIIKKLNNPAIKGNVRVYLGDLNNMFLNNLRASEEVDTSHNLSKYVIEDDVYNLYDKKAALRNEEREVQEQRVENLSKENALDDPDTEQQTVSKNILWLLNSKDTYNHIKINQEAPEFNELVPPDDNESDLRQWWYYSADDYKQFSE